MASGGLSGSHSFAYRHVPAGRVAWTYYNGKVFKPFFFFIKITSKSNPNYFYTQSKALQTQVDPNLLQRCHVLREHAHLI